MEILAKTIFRILKHNTRNCIGFSKNTLSKIIYYSIYQNRFLSLPHLKEINYHYIFIGWLYNTYIHKHMYKCNYQMSEIVDTYIESTYTYFTLLLSYHQEIQIIVAFVPVR